MVLFHKHLIIRAELDKPPMDLEEIKTWMKDLVNEIDMNILMGPYAVYSEMPGNRGITAVAIIETSHITCHVWDEKSPALMQLDVYTCSTLDPYEVTEALKVFEPTKIEMKFIDREYNLMELPV